MRFHKNLYVSESMTKKKEKVIAKLNKKKYPLNTYVIALIEEGENQLEFYSTLMFRQGSVIDDDIFVVGIAGGYDDALYLVEEIAKEVYEKQGIWISGPTSESGRGKKHDSTYHWIDFEDYRDSSSGDSWNPATCDRCPSLCTAEV